MQIVLKKIKNNKVIIKNWLILTAQQRFKSERHNLFTEAINKIALSSSYDKRMQSIDWIETYAYGTSKDLIRKKEKIKSNNMLKKYKNF